MPADYESGFVLRTPAWHGLATVLEESPATAEEALVMAGQDWTVSKAPLQALIPNETQYPALVSVPRRFATYRTDTNAVLGVVGEDWTPVQNSESFRFLDELVGGGELTYESVGVLEGGAKVFILARIPEYLEIGGLESERINRYILVCNGHAGTLAFRVKLVHERVVCSNTLGVALSERSDSFYSRHTSGVMYRTREARDLLQIAFRQDERFAEMADELLHTELRTDSREFRSFLNKLVPILPNADRASQAVKNLETVRSSIRAIAASGTDLAPVRGTAWAALQAAVEYADWHTRVVGDGAVAAERRFKRNVLKDDALKSRAVALLAPGFASAAQKRLAGVR